MELDEMVATQPGTGMPLPDLVRGVGLLMDRRASDDDAAEGRRLNCHAINYIIRGEGRFRDADTPEQEVGPGSMFLLRPGVWHRYAPLRSWDECWLTFDRDAVCASFGEIIPGPPGHRRGPSDPLVIHAFTALSDLWLQRPRRYDVLSRQHLHHLLLHWFTAWNGTAQDASDGLVAQAKAFMQAHLGAPALDLRRFARAQGLSFERFRKRFVAEAGLPPHRCWSEMKLRYASTLLRSSRLSVQEVAASVGIADAAYFSRLFARHTGLPPGRYRTRERAARTVGDGA